MASAVQEMICSWFCILSSPQKKKKVLLLIAARGHSRIQVGQDGSFPRFWRDLMPFGGNLEDGRRDTGRIREFLLQSSLWPLKCERLGDWSSQPSIFLSPVPRGVPYYGNQYSTACPQLQQGEKIPSPASRHFPPLTRRSSGGHPCTLKASCM